MHYWMLGTYHGKLPWWLPDNSAMDVTYVHSFTVSCIVSYYRVILLHREVILSPNLTIGVIIGNQLGVNIDQVEVTIDQVGVNTDQVGVTIDQVGVNIDQLGVTIDQAEVTIDQAEVTIDQAEVTIDQAEVTIEQVEVTIDQVGVTIDQVGVTTGPMSIETGAAQRKESQARDPPDIHQNRIVTQHLPLPHPLLVLHQRR